MPQFEITKWTIGTCNANRKNGGKYIRFSDYKKFMRFRLLCTISFTMKHDFSYLVALIKTKH